jgi:predicted DNA-binding transcriptional regulator AlpA
LATEKGGRAVAKTFPPKRPAAQVVFGKKVANVKAESAHTSTIAPDLIEANEQSLADEALATATRPAREHDERSVHAARGPPAQFRLLSKREVLAIVNVSYPTLWSWMRRGTFPRSRVAGGRSVWRSDEVEAWLAGLPVRKLKGDNNELAND